MRESEKERRLEAFRRNCRDRGLAFTPQRSAILGAVLDLDNHPTADQVHLALARRRPRVSRATVFRTLEAFAREGIISKACHPGTAVRYDWRTETHHHLVCLRCDQVIDFADPRLDVLPVPDTRSLGFVVSELRVQLRGLCRRCRELEDKK
jgi:Fur family transcriptional regulator, peroxide stress response regulator